MLQRVDREAARVASGHLLKTNADIELTTLLKLAGDGPAAPILREAVAAEAAYKEGPDGVHGSTVDGGGVGSEGAGPPAKQRRVDAGDKDGRGGA